MQDLGLIIIIIIIEGLSLLQSIPPTPLHVEGWGHARPQRPRAPTTAGPPPGLINIINNTRGLQGLRVSLSRVNSAPGKTVLYCTEFRDKQNFQEPSLFRSLLGHRSPICRSLSLRGRAATTRRAISHKQARRRGGLGGPVTPGKT